MQIKAPAYGWFITVLASNMRWSFVTVFMAFPIITTAAEVSPLRFTDVDGFIALRYLYDDYATTSQGIDSRKGSNPTFQEEFALNTQSYVYHPNMLNMNLGGSVLYDQSDFETLQGESSSDTRRFNYFAYLDFLGKKPYPLTLYYDQKNPSVSPGLEGRFIQENTKYGFNFSLLQPFSPVQITMEAFRLTSQGEGLDQVVDDVREQASIRFYHSYGSGDFAELSHQINNIDSRSGSPDLEIEQRIYTTESSILTSRNVFGATKQVQLNNYISYSTQDEYPVRKDFRFNPNISWQHSENMHSFYRYNISDTSEETQDTDNRRLTMGLAKSGPDINANFDLHGEDSETTGLKNKNHGGFLSLSQSRAVSIGDIQLNYNGNYDRNNQETAVATLPVFGEEHALFGTTPVELLNGFIEISTIIVSNLSRTQIYVEDLDYRLLIVGSTVQMQRLTGGNILDGQTVLVDYSYETGGTYEYDIISQSVNLSLAFARYYDVYFRYLNRRQELLDGDPSIPLNSIDRSTIGVRADKSLSSGINLGGEVYYVNSNEDISPFVKQSYDAYIELPLPKLTDVRFSARQLRTDNENSEEDVDLNGYILRINSRPWLRTKLSYESSYEIDTGGTLDRLMRNHRLSLGWRVRQLSVNLSAGYYMDQQGDTDRDRWTIRFVAKREFN